MSDDHEWMERIRIACAKVETIPDAQERGRLIAGLVRAITRGYYPAPSRLADVLKALDP